MHKNTLFIIVQNIFQTRFVSSVIISLPNVFIVLLVCKVILICFTNCFKFN